MNMKNKIRDVGFFIFAISYLAILFSLILLLTLGIGAFLIMFPVIFKLNSYWLYISIPVGVAYILLIAYLVLYLTKLGEK